MSTAAEGSPFWLDPTARVEPQSRLVQLAGLADDVAAAAGRAAEGVLGGAGDREELTSAEQELARSVAHRLGAIGREATELAESLREGSGPGPSTGDRGETEIGQVSPGARVLVRQMAAEGYAADEIAVRLTEDFGIRDASMVVERLSRPSKRP